MNIVLSVLAIQDTNAKKLSLSNIVTSQNHTDVMQETLIGLSPPQSALVENTVDQMINP